MTSTLAVWVCVWRVGACITSRSFFLLRWRYSGNRRLWVVHMRVVPGNRFTLIEVLVAVSILGLSLVLLLNLLGAARSRVLRAERRWAREHLLTQAIEFFLVSGADSQLPGDLLPSGFTATCELRDVDDLPDVLGEPIYNMQLKIVHVGLYDINQELVAERGVEKIVSR